MSKRQGPITVHYCGGCEYLHERRLNKSINIFAFHCIHHTVPQDTKPKGYIGLDTITPDWCPFLKKE